MRLFFLMLIPVFMSMTGCITTATKMPVPVEEPIKLEIVPSDTEALVQYAAYLRRLSVTDLNREHEALKQTVAKSRTDLSRAQLAMIYALPGLPLRDDAKALPLLESLGKDAISPTVRNFALLLLSLVADNKRLDEAAQVLNGKVKDEQKLSGELQQKLDALKSIEKSLSERDRSKSPTSIR